MALKKSYDSTLIATPIADAYFRIVSSNVDYRTGYVFVAVDCYFNEASRRAGKEALTRLSFTLTPSIDQGADRKTLYAALKADKFFTDAVDV